MALRTRNACKGGRGWKRRRFLAQGQEKRIRTACNLGSRCRSSPRYPAGHRGGKLSQKKIKSYSL